MPTSLPISAVIATRNRQQALARALDSLLVQDYLPAELIAIDSSDDDCSRSVLKTFATRVGADCRVSWHRAGERGAAPQRNLGVGLVTQPFVWFFDDDVVFERGCVAALWNAMQSDERLGGVNAMIVNQRYSSPGTVSRAMFALLAGGRSSTFAGRVIGPAVNLLPEDRDDLPPIVEVDWLNTGCTMYRRSALPSPPFDSVFTGYSMMEDLTLSLRVGRVWKLANARTARIFHDSQPAEYKSSARALAAMELMSRHYVMTEVLGRTGLRHHLQLALWELFQIATCLGTANRRHLVYPTVIGKATAVCGLLRRRSAKIAEKRLAAVHPAQGQ